MKFEEALAAMMKGKTIKRKGYAECISLNDMDDIELSDCLHVEWEIYEEPKWEPEKGGYVISSDGSINHYIFQPFSFSAFGHTRPTQQQAEAARDKMREFNRLLAYVDEHSDPAEIAEWSVGQSFDGVWGKRHFNFEKEFPGVVRMAGVVRMGRQCAEKLVDDLNSGRVVL